MSVPPDIMLGYLVWPGIHRQDRRVHRVHQITVERGLVRRQILLPAARDVGADQLVDLALEGLLAPGRTRQSITASADAGMTLAL